MMPATMREWPPIRLASGIANRARADVLLADRRGEYEAILNRLRAEGFTSLTLRELALLYRGKGSMPKRLVVLRHDIDTDPDYALVWLALEQKYGFTASYYFRHRTADVELMQHIERHGSEASYHFEELATVARRHGLWDGPVTDSILTEARCEFEHNFCALRAKSMLPLQTVASHGDFVNRRLGITNCAILECDELRTRLGIIAEAYDRGIVELFDARISDTMGSQRWRWSSIASSSRANGTVLGDGSCPDPSRLIENGALVLQILTHPRHWRANIICNLSEDFDRLLMGCLAWAGWPAGRLAAQPMRGPAA